MASENLEPREAAFKETRKQEEGGETSNMPPQEKEATAKQAFSNLPAVLLSDKGIEQYHLFRPPPADNGIRPLNFKPTAWKDGLLLGSVEGGWLIFYRNLRRLQFVVSGYEDQCLCYNCIFFLNPLSGAKLSLPPEPCFVARQDFKPHLVADVITSNCSPDSPEFLAVAFFMNSGRHWLAFCKMEYESWTRIADIKHTRGASILIQLALALDDKNKLLYLLHLTPSAPNYDMMVFDLKDSKNIKRKRLVMAESNNLPREGIFSRANKREERQLVIINLNIGDRRLYLTADSSCGDLFMVLQENDLEGSICSILPVKSYRVFIKVDEGGPQWEEIHDLGDRSIFISHFGSRVISTAELNLGSKPEEQFFRGNCIYFALQNVFKTARSLKRDIGVFSLADRSIKHFPLPSKFQKTAHGTLWFNPRST